MVPLTADDFIEEATPHGAASVWNSRNTLTTPFGPYEIYLLSPPDAEVLAQVNQLAGFVSEHYGDIQELVFDHYQRACEHRQWMRDCGVPLRLRYDRVAKYVRTRSITARRARDGEVKGAIFITPEWDTEHGIDLAVRDGRLVSGDE